MTQKSWQVALALLVHLLCTFCCQSGSKNNDKLVELWIFSIYVDSGKKVSCSTVELVGNGFGQLTPPRQILGKFMGGFEWKKTYRSKARCHPKASLHTLRYCLIFLRCVFARSELNLTTHNYYAIQRVGIWEGAKYFFMDVKDIVSSTVCCRMQKKTCGKEDAKLCWRFDAGILPLTLHRSGFTLQNNAVHQNAWVGITISKLQQYNGQNERCHWKGGPLKGGWQVGRPEMPMTLFPSVGSCHPAVHFSEAFYMLSDSVSPSFLLILSDYAQQDKT